MAMQNDDGEAESEGGVRFTGAAKLRLNHVSILIAAVVRTSLSAVRKPDATPPPQYLHLHLPLTWMLDNQR